MEENKFTRAAKDIRGENYVEVNKFKKAVLDIESKKKKESSESTSKDASFVSSGEVDESSNGISKELREKIFALAPEYDDSVPYEEESEEDLLAIKEQQRKDLERKDLAKKEYLDAISLLSPEVENLGNDISEQMKVIVSSDAYKGRDGATQKEKAENQRKAKEELIALGERSRYVTNTEDLLKKSKKWVETADHGTLKSMFNSPLAKDFFTVGATEVFRNFDVLSIANKAKAGEVLTKEEDLALRAYGFNQEVQSDIEKSLASTVGSGISETIPYLIQFAVSTPASAGTRTAVKKGVEKVLGESASKHFATKAIANLAGGVTQSFFLSDLYANYPELQVGVVAPQELPSGEIVYRPIAETQDTPIEAAAKSFAITYSTVMLERFGGVGERLGKTLTSKLAPTGMVNMIGKESVEQMGKSGFAATWMKEYATEMAQMYSEKAIRDEQLVKLTDAYTPKEILATGLITAFFSGGVVAAESSIGGNNRARLDAVRRFNEVSDVVSESVQVEVDKVLAGDDMNKNAEQLDTYLKKKKAEGATDDQIQGVVDYALGKTGMDSMSESSDIINEDLIKDEETVQDEGAIEEEVVSEGGSEVTEKEGVAEEAKVEDVDQQGSIIDEVVQEDSQVEDTAEQEVSEVDGELPQEVDEEVVEQAEDVVDEAEIDPIESDFEPKEVLFDTPMGDKGLSGEIVEDLGDKYKVRSNDGTVYRVSKEKVTTDSESISKALESKASEIRESVKKDVSDKIGRLDDKKKQVQQELFDRLNRLSGAKRIDGEKSVDAVSDLVGSMRNLVDLGVIELQKSGIKTYEAFKAYMAKVGRPVTVEEDARLREAVDNEFDFDDVISESGVAAEEAAVEMGDMTTIDRARRQLEDRFLRLKQFQQTLEDKGYNISPELDVYGSVMLQTSAASNKVNKAIERVVRARPKQKKAILQDLSDSGVEMSDFSRYLWAKHSAERNKKVRERNNATIDQKVKSLNDVKENLDPDSYSTVNGYNKAVDRINKKISDLEVKRITDKEISHLEDKSNKFISDIEGANPEVAALADRVQSDLIKPRLDMMIESGLIDQAEYDRLSEYDNYVPYDKNKDVLPESNAAYPEGTTVNVSGREVFGATNLMDIDQSSNRVNPLVQGLFNLRNTAMRGEKNKTIQSLRDLAESAPSGVINIVSPKYNVEYNENGELQYVYRDSKYTPSPSNNYIEYRDNGKPVLLEINDPDLLRAFRGTGVRRGIKVLDRMNSYFRAIYTTKNPAFIVPNFIRDIQTAGINITVEDKKGIRRKLLKSVPGAMRGVYDYHRGLDTEWTSVVEEFKEIGGDIGWMNLNDIDTEVARIEKYFKRFNSTKKTDQLLNAFDSVGSYLESLGSVAELSTRVATYKAAIDSGVSKKDAAKLAKNVTVNFEKKGEGSSMLNSMYLFANASIQGNVNIIRAVGKSKKARAMVATLYAAGFSLSYLNSLISPEEWELVPDAEKERNLIIMKPGGGYVKMPLPYGFNAFKFAGDLSYDVYSKDKKPFEASLELFKSGFSTFSPIGSSWTSAIPTAPLKTVTEMATNRNWAGAPIKPETGPFAKEVPESEKYFQSVTKPSKWASKSINEITGGNKLKQGEVSISPEYFDHVFELATGGVGKFFKNLYTTGESAVKGEHVDKNSIPIFRRFAGSVKDRDVLSVVYDMSKNSFRKEYSDAQKKKFNNALGKALKDGLITVDRYKDIKSDFNEGQYLLKVMGSDPEKADTYAKYKELKKKKR